MSHEDVGVVKRLERLRSKSVASKFPHWLACHPCFNPQAHFQSSRLHLPVAPRCNIQCGYCKRGIDKCEHRPGATRTIMKPEDAAKLVNELVAKDGSLQVVAIAGPGEPLFNDETFETLRLVHERHPDLIKCIATNGLMLEEKAPSLKDVGVRAVTITINALDPKVASNIYEFVVVDGRVVEGLEAAEVLIEKQLKGLEKAVDAGLAVKVNTVLIPEVNEGEVAEIARKAAELGAFMQNVIPLIPLHSFKNRRPPTCEELRSIREEAGKHIRQFKLCKQCRADSYGVPGFERRSRGQGEMPYLTFHA